MNTSGSFTTAALTATNTFSLTCTGVGGAVTRTASVAIISTGDPTAASAATLGPYAVQTYTSGLATGSNYVAPKVWYPVGAAGSKPGVVYIPGLNTSYVSSQPSITDWGPLLASHGFIVMFIDARNLGADPVYRKAALQQAIEVLVAENTRSGSPIVGGLDTQKIAVMGHSFGGAGAFYAANDKAHATNGRIKAVIGLSPVPNSGYYTGLAVPSLILAGVGDPFFSDFIGQFVSIPLLMPKMIAQFSRTSEFSDMHDIALYPLGTHTTDPAIARLGHSFLQMYLMGDQRYQQFLVNQAGTSLFTYNNPL